MPTLSSDEEDEEEEEEEEEAAEETPKKPPKGSSARKGSAAKVSTPRVGSGVGRGPCATGKGGKDPNPLSVKGMSRGLHPSGRKNPHPTSPSLSPVEKEAGKGG